jgi:hypothetical protein
MSRVTTNPSTARILLSVREQCQSEAVINDCIASFVVVLCSRSSKLQGKCACLVVRALGQRLLQ